MTTVNSFKRTHQQNPHGVKVESPERAALDTKYELVNSASSDMPPLSIDAMWRFLRESLTGVDLSAVITRYQQATAEAEEAGNLREEAMLLLVLGRIYRQKADYLATVEPLERSLALWTRLGDSAGIAIAQWDLATQFIHRGLEEEAFSHAQHALILFRNLGDRYGEAIALTNLSIIYKKLGDIALAQELLHQCLAYFEETENAQNAAICFLNMMANYMVLEEFDQAIEYGKRGLEVIDRTPDRKNATMARMQIGSAYVRKAEQALTARETEDYYEAALEYFRSSLSLAQEIGLVPQVANTLGSMGNALLKRGLFEEADAVLSQAISIYLSDEQVGILHRSGYCDTLLRMGMLYSRPEFAGRDDERALKYLQEARELVEDDDAAILLVSIYAALVDLYDQMGRPQEALDASRRLREIERRFFNEDSSRRIRNLQVKFDTEKAQKDAELAQLRNVELVKVLDETEQLRVFANKRAEYNQRIALTLQEAVLPTLPARIVPGLEVQTFYLPTSDEAAIGGDFYDVFPLDEGKAAIVVGDVIGHGLEAAISISEVRFALRTLLSQNPSGDIGDTLSQLNNFLVKANAQKRIVESNRGKPTQNRLVALTLITIEPATGEICAVAAGMEPILVIRSGTDAVEYLDAGDMILGAISNLPYEAKRTTFAAGDMLAVTTDGITEAFSETGNLQFGLEGLARSLSFAQSAGGKLSSHSLQSLGEVALSAVRDFIGGPCRDDVCLLLARLEPTSGEGSTTD